MKKVLDEFVNFFTNKAGISLALINFTLALLGLYMKEFAYFYFHFHYEPMPIKILCLFNFPAMIAEEFISEQFFSVPETSFGVTVSKYEFIIIIICSILQWLFIGYIFHKLFPKKELK